jgi:cytochrome c oxidase cbb3-type subunit 3
MPTKIEKDTLTGTDTTGHEWDGLKELNTPLPKWWLYVLYATIAFAAVWVVLYPALPIRGATGMTGWIAREAVVHDVRASQERMGPMLARIRAATPAIVAADPELRAFAIAGGRTAFANNCAACHGERGEGNRDVGAPRLSDQVWLFGSDKASLVRTVSYSRAGVMPAWGQRLDPAIVTMLAVYVHALGGGEN